MTKKKVISFAVVIMLLLQFSTLFVNAVPINMTQNTSNPSSWLYYGSMVDSNRFIAPSITLGGNVSYCIGTSAQDTPSGQDMIDMGYLSDSNLAKMISAGYPFTPSQYGLGSRDYHYVTQMAVRCYVEGRNISQVHTSNSAFLNEFTRIYNARYSASNPTQVSTSINGSANRTLVMVNSKAYYRNGPYAPTVSNGSLTNNYRISLTNSSAFHQSNPNPTSTNNNDWYTNAQSFYVYVPATSAGSTQINLDIPPTSITSDIQIEAFTPSSNPSIQKVAVVHLNVVHDPASQPIDINWTAETGRLQVTKTTTESKNISGVQFNLSGTSTIGIPINISATTDASGIASFVYDGSYDIPVGTYSLSEISSSVNPSYSVANSQNVTISSGSSQNINVNNVEKTGSIQVKKTTPGMVNLASLSFVLTGTSDSGRNINIEAVTNDEGIATFTGVPIGSYQVSEKSSSVPYAYLTADPKNVTVQYAQTTSIEIANAEKTGTIQVKKTTPGLVNLADLTFILSGKSDTGRDIKIEAITDMAGIAKFENIPIGTYTVAEKDSSVPYAYLTADPEDVTVQYAQTTSIEIANAEKTGSIQIKKTTPGMVNLANLTFILSGKSDTGRDIKIEAVTDKNGIAKFDSIPIGTYQITEKSSSVPYAYLTADPKSVTVQYAQTTNIAIANAEKTGTIQIKKTTPGMVNLADLTFILSGKSDTGRDIKIEAITDKNGIAKFEKIPIGSYQINEKGSSVPYAYLTADSEDVSVSYAKTTNLEINNAEKTGTIQIKKTTPGMLNLANLTFILSGKSETGRDITVEAVTDKDGIAKFDKVPIGSYQINEKGSSVPYAYLTADSEDISVSYTKTTSLEINNDEKTGSIKVSKATRGMKDIANITFILSGTSDSGREINFEATTDENGIAIFDKIPIGTYKVIEKGTTVPYGYLTADPKDVTVDYAQEVNVDVLNLPDPNIPLGNNPDTQGDNTNYFLVFLCLASACIVFKAHRWVSKRK